MSATGYLDEQLLGWADMVSTGIEPRQLRSAIDRGLLSIGHKGRHGRLTFTMRDRFTVDLINALTSVWMPISTACAAATEIAKDLASIIEFQRTERPQQLSDGLWISIGNAGSELALGYRVKDALWRPKGGRVGPYTFIHQSVHVSVSLHLARLILFITELGVSPDGTLEGDPE